MSGEFLTSKELLKRWGNAIHPGTLANWRHKGKGPDFVRLGSKIVYPLTAVIDFEAKNRTVKKHG